MTDDCMTMSMSMNMKLTDMCLSKLHSMSAVRYLISYLKRIPCTINVS